MNLSDGHETMWIYSVNIFSLIDHQLPQMLQFLITDHGYRLLWKASISRNISSEMNSAVMHNNDTCNNAMDAAHNALTSVLV